MIGKEQYLSIVQPFLQQLVDFLPRLVLAIIVFVIGYFISVGIGKLVTEILKGLKFNQLFKKENWQKALEKADIKVDPSGFIGAIFKWVFVIVSLLLTVDILNLTKFAELLRDVLNYLPNVIVAALIFVVAVIVADVLEKTVRATVERMKISYAALTASVVKWAIWIFAIFLILDNLLPASELIQTLYKSIVYGVVAAISVGVGLAFGLGGKDLAAGVLEDLRKRIKER